MIEVLCTRCDVPCFGMDSFRAHCADVHPEDAGGMREIAALAEAELTVLEVQK